MSFEKFVSGVHRKEEAGITISADARRVMFGARMRTEFGATPGKSIVWHFDAENRRVGMKLLDQPEDGSVVISLNTQAFFGAFARRYGVTESSRSTYHKVDRDEETGLLVFDISKRLPGREEGLEVINGRELMAMDFPELKEWVVPGLLPCGLTVLYGKPGVGKTHLIWSWILSRRQGTSLSGRFPSTPGHSSVLNRAVHLQDVRDHLENHPDLEMVVIEDFSQWKNSDDRNLPIALMELGREYESCILVTFQADDEGNCMEPCDGMIWQGCCDALLYLEKTPTGRVLEWKGRNAAPFTMPVEEKGQKTHA